MRRPLMVANWKMHKTVAESVAFARAFLPLVKDAERVDVGLAPPFTALAGLGAELAASRVELCSQNVNAAEKGAFTGEIAPSMLVDVGCSMAIVGHSERRTLYGETDATVAAKTAALFAAGIRPVVCVGETLEEREADRTLEVIARQVAGSLADVPAERASELAVAYEPIWAIGTGRTATPEIAQQVHGALRAQLRDLFGDTGDRIRIQYGGSVKPDNVASLMAQPDIDGALVGGASLDPESFARIVHFDRQGDPS